MERQGSKLWVLIFASFIASIGLNVHSAALVIGTLLISPLMGPILGMGCGAGTLPVLLVHLAWHQALPEAAAQRPRSGGSARFPLQGVDLDVSVVKLAEVGKRAAAKPATRRKAR